MYSAENMT